VGLLSGPISLGSALVAEALRTEGETVEVHDAHFAKDASDVEWLGAVGHTDGSSSAQDRIESG